MKSKYRVIVVAAFVLWTIVSFVFFQIFYKYHLLHRLDMQLFLYSRDYVLGYFGHPAWLASLAGDFLTQSFYFNVAGALVQTFVILALGILFYQSLGRIVPFFQNNGECDMKSRLWMRIVLSLCVMTWELFRSCGLEYNLSSTLALVGGLTLFLLYLQVPFRVRYVSAVLLPLLAYWLFGYGLWILLFFILLCELRSRHYILALACLVVSVTIPFLLRQSYALTVPQSMKYPSALFWNKPDFTIEKLLEMDVLGFNNQWYAVSQLSAQYNMRSGIASYFYNLSHAICNELPDKVMDYYQPGVFGLLFQLNPKTPFLAIWSSNEVWFQLGDMTMAEHSALLGMIFSPNHRSVRMVKRLAEINMVNGDTAAAMKYLCILQKTWLYNSWANERIPGKESDKIKTWLHEKRSFIPQTDTIRDVVNPAMSLRLLLDSNRANKLALDYLLCYDLLAKDIPAFMSDYDTYRLPKHEAAERIYAQALLIGLAMQRTPAEDVRKYMIAPEIFADFETYTGLYEKNDLGRSRLADQFGKTYWFYYHFATFK